MNNLKEISKMIAKDFRKENNIKLPKDRKEMLSKMTRKEKLNYIDERILLTDSEKLILFNYIDKQLDDYILKYTTSSIEDIL